MRSFLSDEALERALFPPGEERPTSARDALHLTKRVLVQLKLAVEVEGLRPFGVPPCHRTTGEAEEAISSPNRHQCGTACAWPSLDPPSSWPLHADSDTSHSS